MTNNSSESNKNSDSAFNKNMTTTDTPRTDAYTDPWNWWDIIPAEVSRQLERELKASQEAYLQSVERDDYLTQALAEADRELHMWEMGNYYKPKMQSKIDELEGEVERLRSNLGRVIKIAEEFWDNQKQAVLVYHQELADELDQLKATIKIKK